MNIITLCSFLVILSMCDTIICWDNTEMQMFDLVEELNGTFYEYLGVDGNATSNEIKRAYRKLSLRYHPDRNPSSEDAMKFQKLVTIYEILKEDKSRERYNEVLKFGLPDWRMPSYYFRKLRKMSFGESLILFAILATAIHYACLWGAYFEEKWNMEAFLFRRKKQRTQESKMNEVLNKVFKPRWKDILPLVIVRFIYNLVVSTPTNVKSTCDIVKQEIKTVIDKQFEQKRRDKEKEEERKKIEENKKLKKEKKQSLSHENKEKRNIYEEGVLNAKTLPIETFCDIPIIEKDESDKLVDDPWTKKNTVAVIRALSEYPSGVTDRWIKISDFVKRPLSEIIIKVKEVQANSKEGRIPINTMLQNSPEDNIEDQALFVQDDLSSESENDGSLPGKSSSQKKKERKKLAKNVTVASIPIKTLDVVIEPVVENEENESIDNADESVIHQRKKPRKKAKYLEASEPIGNVYWTPTEQKQLEDAVRKFPNGTTDRWDKISNKVPTKTKAECIERMTSKSTEESNNINGH